jgi:hypothetical protein
VRRRARRTARCRPLLTRTLARAPVTGRGSTQMRRRPCTTVTSTSPACGCGSTTTRAWPPSTAASCCTTSAGAVTPATPARRSPLVASCTPQSQHSTPSSCSAASTHACTPRRAGATLRRPQRRSCMTRNRRARASRTATRCVLCGAVRACCCCCCCVWMSW